MNYVLGALCLAGLGASYTISRREEFYFYPTVYDEFAEESNDYWIDNVHGLFYPHSNSKKLVIVIHGNAGNVFSRRRLAIELNKLGYNCYLMEYPGFGKMHNQGPPSENKIKTAARKVMEHWTNKFSEFTLFGESIGCCVATGIATEFKVQKIILLSGPSSIKDMIDQFIVNGLGSCIADELDTVENLGNMKGQPELLVLHSFTDEIVHIDNAHRVLSKLETLPNKHFFKEVKGTHNTSIIPWKYIGVFLSRSVWPSSAIHSL